MTEPTHAMWIETPLDEEGDRWFVAVCKCGWRGNPKLSEMGAMDEQGRHVLDYNPPETDGELEEGER